MVGRGSEGRAVQNSAANTVEMVEEVMADLESMCMINSMTPVEFGGNALSTG